MMFDRMMFGGLFQTQLGLLLLVEKQLRLVPPLFYLVPKTKNMSWDTPDVTQHHRYSAEGCDCDDFVANKATCLLYPITCKTRWFVHQGQLIRVYQCGKMCVNRFSSKSWVTPWKWFFFMTVQDVNFSVFIKALCFLYPADVRWSDLPLSTSAICCTYML